MVFNCYSVHISSLSKQCINCIFVQLCVKHDQLNFLLQMKASCLPPSLTPQMHIDTYIILFNMHFFDILLGALPSLSFNLLNVWINSCTVICSSLYSVKGLCNETTFQFFKTVLFPYILLTILKNLILSLILGYIRIRNPLKTSSPHIIL
jgi:hypothetical protein